MHSILMAVVAMATVITTSAVAADRVDLELVLLADASRSIDDAEIWFQRQGYADAVRRKLILEIADVRQPIQDKSPDAPGAGGKDRG